MGRLKEMFSGFPNYLPKPATTQTPLNTLKKDIEFYSNKNNFNAFEIGHRLILAKTFFDHGVWQKWLQNMFGFTIRTARRFKQIYERFSQKAFASNFGFSQLTELLSLPAGEEEKFIRVKADEGIFIESLTIQKLRAEVKNYRATLKMSVRDLSPADKSFPSARESNFNDVDTDLNVSTAVDPSKASSQQSTVNDSSLPPPEEKTLGRLFNHVNSLLKTDDLQKVVATCISTDISSFAKTFEKQLQQLASLYGNLRGCFDALKIKSRQQKIAENVSDEKVSEETAENIAEEKIPSEPLVAEKIELEGEVLERKSIISSLYQVLLNDDENFTKSARVRDLMQALGCDLLENVPTKDVYYIVKIISEPVKEIQNQICDAAPSA